MTDQIDQITETDIDEIENGDGGAGRRRRMFLTGAGIAGAAAIVGKSGVANAADGDPIVAGQVETATVRTGVSNTGSNSGIPGTPGNEALYGQITQADNGSHAILGVTAGSGHAVAGVIGAQVAGEAPTFPETTVAATWGRHYGPAAAVEGQQLAEGVDLAGTANAVKGRIDKTSNGSHAVLGVTNGAGHSIAGDTPGMVPDVSDGAAPDAMVPNPNTTAATWGRHGGAGAGIGGVSAAGYGGEFVGGKAHVRLIQVDNDDLGDGQTAVVGPPTDDDHALGELFADGRGKLYYNSGTGSNFHMLVQQELFEDPQRAWDTRPGQGPDNPEKGLVQPGDVEQINLTSFTDVPEGVSAVLINISVANTGGKGFLTVYNGDTDTVPNAASLTWSDADQRVTNGLTVRPSESGVINVYLAETTANIIVDVTGYII